MTSYSLIAEYYFEYKMVRVSGSADIREPRLYFERNYRNPGLPYTTYAVPFEWVGKQDIFNSVNEKTAEERRRNLAKLPYDSVKVVFDIKGIECAPLTDVNSENYKLAESPQEQDFEQFYKGECRTPIDNLGAEDHSGVGYIEMFKGGESVARFFFAINYVMRKQISYELKRKDKKLQLKFICHDRPKGIKVKVTYNTDALPCLKNEAVVPDGIINLDFSGKMIYECEVPVAGDKFKDAVFSLAFADQTIEKYYILDCILNDTVKLKAKKDVLNPDITCPYCQQKMKVSILKSSAYKNGAVACNYGYEGVKPDKIEIVSNTDGSKRQAKVKHCIYCKNDVEGQSGSKTFNYEFNRLLPRDFMKHDCFKIAFTGSMRAGKTTYISRFFDIGLDHGAKTDMTMMSNSLSRYSIDISSSLIPMLEPLGADTYKISKRNWISEQKQYQDRAISINPQKFPGATTSSAKAGGTSYEKYPFVAEVNKRYYVSFYDVAGEDAQSSTLITNIANGSIIGVFLLVNGNMNVDQTKSVISMLRNAKLDRRCPVAVMLAKMDMLEKEFDSNAQCLRTDYFEHATSSYENSHLSNVIDTASEEIRAYLLNHGINLGLENDFNNVRYFGVTSFNFNDSIHAEGDSIDRPGNVNFICSSKRLELPFIWMLKQFGVIR